MLLGPVFLYGSAMEKAAMFDVVTAQRRRLIGVLDDLSEEQWNTQSLCEKWRVRDVVGHLVSVLDIPAGRFLWRSIRARSYDDYAAVVAANTAHKNPANSWPSTASWPASSLPRRLSAPSRL